MTAVSVDQADEVPGRAREVPGRAGDVPGRAGEGKFPVGDDSAPPEGTALVAALEARLAAALGTPVTVDALSRMSGGASRETWAFDATTADGAVRRLVLRRGAGVGSLVSGAAVAPNEGAGAVAAPGAGSGASGGALDVRVGAPDVGVGPAVGTASMMLEAAASSAAGHAGVPVPAILLAVHEAADLGGSALIAERIDGETLARRIYRALDAAGPRQRSALAAQCAAAAVRLHTVSPEEVEGLAAVVDPLAQQRAVMDELGVVSPAFELGLRWLGAHRPPPSRSTLVHGDFRIGNMIVGPSGLAAVLDWELVHAGDPLEDLGWFCSRAWRFGEDHLEAGGLCSVDELAKAYGAESGRSVDRAALAWWIVMADLRWGVICAKQAERHLSGAEESVELATIGRRLPEAEWDVLSGLHRAGWSTVTGSPGGTALTAMFGDDGPGRDGAGSSSRSRPGQDGDGSGAVLARSSSGRDDAGSALAGSGSGREGVGAVLAGSGSGRDDVGPVMADPRASRAGGVRSGVGDLPGRVGGVTARTGRSVADASGQEHIRPAPPEVHGRPSAAVLVEAVRRLLDGPVRAALTGPTAFQSRVAANALRMVERELLLGPGQRVEAGETLAALGYATEDDLAAAIRSGSLDDRLDEVSGPIAQIVAMRLDVVHPGYDSAEKPRSWT